MKEGFDTKKYSALWRNSNLVDDLDGHAPLFEPVRTKCPYCGSPVMRYGRQKCNGRQRYKCANDNCGHTFVSSRDTVFYRGRLCRRQFADAVCSLTENLTVRELAKRLGVAKNTAFRYRWICLRLLRGIKKDPILKGKTGIDEMIFNLPGELDGKPAGKGISNKSHQLAIGIDEFGTVMAGDLGRGKPDSQRIKAFWDSKLAEVTSLYHDCLPAYNAAFKDFCGEQEWFKSTAPSSKEDMKKVNGASSSLRWFMRRHTGIIPSSLPFYLSWFNDSCKTCDWASFEYWSSFYGGMMKMYGFRSELGPNY